MSAAVYISCETPTSADDIAADGKNMLIHFDSFSAIGEDHDLERLDVYVSQTMEEMLEIMDDSIASKEEIEASHKERWFNPLVGLELIEKYISLVKKYHSLSDTTKQQCLPDLEQYREVLKISQRKMFAGISPMTYRPNRDRELLK
jgi:hypothetical protein